MNIPKEMREIIENHMDRHPEGWTIYSVAKILEIPPEEAPLLLNGMTGPDRLKMVYAGKVRAEDSMEGEIAK